MSELDEIRRRKLAEMSTAQQENTHRQMQEEAELQKKIGQLEGIVKQLFTKEALQRYGNIKSVDPDKAVQIIAIIGQMIQSGRVQMIDDNMLKQLLGKITPEKREMKIKRV